jgi:hypothetical protein
MFLSDQRGWNPFDILFHVIRMGDVGKKIYSDNLREKTLKSLLASSIFAQAKGSRFVVRIGMINLL